MLKSTCYSSATELSLNIALINVPLTVYYLFYFLGYFEHKPALQNVPFKNSLATVITIHTLLAIILNIFNDHTH